MVEKKKATKKKVVKKKTVTKKVVKKKTAKKVTLKASPSVKNSRVKGTIKRVLNKKESSKKVVFSIFAPLSSTVFVAGSFNGWDASAFKLKKNSEGHWNGELALKSGRYEYRYLVDGNWENGQQLCELADNGHGSCNCVVTV